jgi:hypothetical protein
MYREHECFCDFSTPNTGKTRKRSCAIKHLEELGVSESGTGEAEQEIDFRPAYSQEQ